MKRFPIFFAVLCLSQAYNVKAQIQPAMKPVLDQQMREWLRNKTVNEDSMLRITFNHTQTIDDLAFLKTELKTKGIDLFYRKLQFDEAGKLTAIEYQVRNSKVGGGDTLEHLTNESTMGFYFDLSKNAARSFGAGDIRRILK